MSDNNSTHNDFENNFESDDLKNSKGEDTFSQTQNFSQGQSRTQGGLNYNNPQNNSYYQNQQNSYNQNPYSSVYSAENFPNGYPSQQSNQYNVYNQNQNSGYQSQGQKPKDTRLWYSVGALILGLFALVGLVIPNAWAFLFLVCGAIALALGIYVFVKKYPGKVMGIIGVVAGGLAILGILANVAFVQPLLNRDHAEAGSDTAVVPKESQNGGSNDTGNSGSSKSLDYSQLDMEKNPKLIVVMIPSNKDREYTVWYSSNNSKSEKDFNKQREDTEISKIRGKWFCDLPVKDVKKESGINFNGLYPGLDRTNLFDM